MKVIAYLLLILVFFLSGVLWGNRDEAVNVDQTREQNQQNEYEFGTSETETEHLESHSLAVQESQTSSTTTEQAAQVIERTSVWFYNQIIQAAYQISDFFI